MAIRMTENARNPQAPGPRLLAGLAKLSMVMKSQAWQDAAPQKLTPTQSQILALLRGCPGESGLRLSDLARGLGVTLATASDAVATLVTKGLVVKQRAEGDARARAILLTPEGRQKADEMAVWPDFLLEAVEALSPAEQEQFLKTVMKMIRVLQEQGRIPVSRMCVECKFFRPNAHPGNVRPHHCALVDAPLAGLDLRLDCPEQEPAEPEVARRHWTELTES
jgi:DNA-binding MarR family transcriptional regulator